MEHFSRRSSSRRPTWHRGRALAITLIMAVIATACASSDDGRAEFTAGLAQSEQAPALDLGTPAQATGGIGSGDINGQHQFGVSLDEFGQTAGASDGPAATASADATEIVWDDLIPPGPSGEEVVARFEERIEAATPGSDEALALYDEIWEAFDNEAVNQDLDGEKVWLAGFVAPLSFEDDIITEFLLVPTFGACIHVPPPPPNQTVVVSIDRSVGLTLDDSWGAVWVEGTMVVGHSSTDLAEASYTIAEADSGVYNNF